MSKVLIVGGTSGLGLEMARILEQSGETVVVAGRTHRKPVGTFHRVDFGSKTERLEDQLDTLLEVTQVQKGIDLLIYAAGVPEYGLIDELSDEHLREQTTVGALVPLMLMRRILRKHKKLPGLILIGSSSQRTPRLRESAYCTVKSGAAKLAECLALDERISRVLVAAPSGMDTTFLPRVGRGQPNLLDPTWVAQTILSEWNTKLHYQEIFILRDPPRIERTKNP